MRAPRVILLGSGQRVSVLVTAGDARLLIATGDDVSEFRNALDAARHPTTRRIDVLLVAGRGTDLVVPAAIRHDRRIRFAASLGPLPTTDEAVVAAGDGLPVLPTPREIRLGDGVTVTLETAAVEDDGEAATVWRAIVRRGATAVAIVSDGDAADRLPTVGPLAALVVAGTDPLVAWSAMPAPVLAVAGDDRVISGKELRQVGADQVDQSGWAVRVHPGEAVPLRFASGGLEIPRDVAQPIPATPANGARRAIARPPRWGIRRRGRRGPRRTRRGPVPATPARSTDRPPPRPSPWRRRGRWRSPSANRRRQRPRPSARCRRGPG